MSHVIAVCNQKGGVAKTTTTFSLCIELAKRGKKVLAVDGDQQGSLSLMFGVTQPDELEATLTDLLIYEAEERKYNVDEVLLPTDEGIDLLPANITMSRAESKIFSMNFERDSVLKRVIAHVKDNYDYVLIDCPPSLSIITVNILTAADEVLIPVQPSIFSIAGMKLLLETIIKTKRSFNHDLEVNGIVYSMVQSNTSFSKEVIDAVTESYKDGIYIYETQLPRSITAERAAANLQSSTDYDPKSKLGIAYSKLADEFISRVEG